MRRVIFHPAAEEEAAEPRKARVENGRLKRDEPTDIPDGTEVLLQIADDWDALDETERAALHREISASIAERDAGAPTFDAEEVVAELGSQR